jgi:hypothetical protein
VTDEQVGAAIAAAAGTVRAPDELRERLARAPRPRRRRRLVPQLAAGGALAAVLAAVLLLFAGGGPTVQEVANAALQAPTRPSSADRADWGERRGWRAVGDRVDEVGGRRSVTSIYRRGGRGVHYAVIDGEPIDVPDGRTVELDGRRYTVLRHDGTAIVTWRYNGHTCVLASKAVDGAALLRFLRGEET